jgi:hypothetical protein
MTGKRDRAASRDAGFYRVLMWLTLCGAGVAGGILAGSLVVADGLSGAPERKASYAGLGGNPAAPATDNLPAPTCRDCADSYGVTARMRAIRDNRNNDHAFRELGAVELEYSPASEPADDYRYGGRFPDAAKPETADQQPLIAVPAEGAPAAVRADDDPPAGDPQLPAVQD